MTALPPVPPPLPTLDIVNNNSSTNADYSIDLEGNENSRDFQCDFTRFKKKVINNIKPIAQSGPK